MPFRQTWSLPDLAELGADQFTERADAGIRSILDRYAPRQQPEPEQPAIAAAPAPPPVTMPSLDLKDWSPWNQGAETPTVPAATATTDPAKPFGLSLDWRDWAPWHQEPAPSAIPGPDQSPGGAPVRSAAEMGALTRPGARVPQQQEQLGGIVEGDPKGFFETAGPYARTVERETGGRVPAALSLAMAANETGYGQRRYMAGANNYHGIQDTTGTGTPYRDWRPGPNGEKVYYEARQAGFASPLEGFRGFARFLMDNPRYAPALDRYQQTGDVNQLAADIHKAGYAEDPAYTTKIQSIIRGIPVQTGVGEVTDTRAVPLTQPRPGATQAEQTPPAQAQAPTSLQGITPAQFGLGDADAEAICGPVLAMAFARSNGRNPTIAEAKQLAQQYGGWTSAQGMGGPEAMANTLRQMGIPATYRPGALDINTIRRETQNGNPVGINTQGHYFVVEGVDDHGRLDLGNSAKALRASGGRQWFRPDEIEGLGMGAPTGAIFKDAPSSPTPSVAVRETGLPPVSLKAGAESPFPASAAPAGPDGVPPAPSGPTASIGMPMPEDASSSERYADSLNTTLPTVPPPMRNEVPFDPETGRAGWPGMQRAPLDGSTPVRDTWASDQSQQPIDPDQGPREATPGSVGAQPAVYDPRVQDEAPGARELPVQPVAVPQAPVGGQDDPGTQVVAPESPAEPLSPFKPLYDAAGQIVGYVQGAAQSVAETVAPTVQAASEIPGRFWEDAGAPIVRAIAPRTGVSEGVGQLIERGGQPAPPSGPADAGAIEAARSVIDPVGNAVQAGATAIEQATGAPAGTVRQAAEDVSNFFAPVAPMAGMVRSGGGMADDAARAARSVLPKGAEAIRLTPAEEVSRLRLDKFPEALRPHIQQAAEAVDFAHDARRGVIPDDVAEQIADTVTRSVDDWIGKSKAGKSLNTEETRALRNLVTGQAKVVDDLAQEIADAEAGGVVTDLLITRAHTEGQKLASLVSVMEGARAEAGRTLRAWTADTRPTDPAEAAQRIFRKFGGGPEGRQRALDALKEFNQIPADDPIARAGFWARVERGGRITTSDVLTAIRYNSMLSSPRTWEIGWIGSVLQAPPKMLSDVMAAASRPGSGELTQAARGAAAGAQAGLRPLWETIRHGITTDQALAGQLPRGLAARATSTAGRAAGTAVDLPGRMVAAPDAFFTQLFRGMETGRQGAIAAYKAGLKGEARAQFIQDFATNTPKAAEAEITRVVDDLMLRGEMGRVGRWAVGGISKDPLIASFVAPFMKISYHIWSQGLDLTPVGALGTGVDVLRGAYRGGNVPQGVRPLAERARYNAIGLGVTGAAVWRALDGQISGIGPDDPEKRQQLRDQGWQPYSIKLGDTWVSYANWGPVAVPLAMAAAYAENQQYKKADAKPEDQMFDMAKRVAMLVTEQTFLQGIGNVMNAFEDPQRYLPQFLAGQVTSLIPYGSALNTVGQSQDDVARRPDRASQVGVAENLTQTVEGRVPINPLTPDRSDVPVAQDVLGRPTPNQQQGPIGYQPFRISQERPDPVIRAFQTAGVDIGRPPSDVTDDGVKIELTPAEQRRWNELRGQEIIKDTQRLIDNGVLGRLPAVRQSERLTDIKAGAGEAATRALRREIGTAEWTRRRREARGQKAG